MHIKRPLLAVGFMFAAMLTVFQAHAQAPDPSDKNQMRQMAYAYCSKSANATVCNCFADTLVRSFNENDWKIFIADASGSSAPPSGIGQAELDGYGRKLAAAGNTCGMQ